MWAIGFAFYLSKEPKPEQKTWFDKNADHYAVGSSATLFDHNYCHYHQQPENLLEDSTQPIIRWCGTKGISATYNMCGSDYQQTMPPIAYTTTMPPTIPHATKKITRSQTIKNLEIGAGAQINQGIGIDPNNIDFWQPEPTGLIYINYISEKQCQEILTSKKRQDKAEGPLSGLRVGN